MKDNWRQLVRRISNHILGVKGWVWREVTFRGKNTSVSSCACLQNTISYN